MPVLVNPINPDNHHRATSYPMKYLSPITYKSFALLLVLLAAQRATAVTYVWNVAAPGGNNWNVNANWDPATGNPNSADTALFGDLGTAFDQFTANNIVSVNTAITALSYTNSLAGTWHVTEVPAGTTLSVSGPVTVGGGGVTGLNTSAAMVGGGTFLATGTAFNIGNPGPSSGTATPGTLDLSNLTNFVYNASGGTIGIAATGSRGMGTLTLAAISNRITASTININGATGTGSSPQMNLGAGTNVINVSTFNVGGGRSTTTLQFLTGDGGLRLRGTGGTDNDRCSITFGNRNTGGTGTLTTTGNGSFNGHPIDMKLSTLTLGLMSRNTSAAENNFQAVGNFQFDQGVVDVTTVAMGVHSGTTTNSRAIGTLTIGANGVLTAGSVSLGNLSSGAANSGVSGTLSILGGSATVTGNLIKSTTSSTGTVEVTSGTLIVAGRIGGSANPIDNVNLTDANLTFAVSSTVTNVAVVNLTTGGSTNTINISSVPAITAYPAQFPVISYSGAIGGAGFENNIGLGSLPAASPGYVGYLSNNLTTATIDLVITAGPNPAQAVSWSGAQNGAWNTSSLNWLAGAIPTNYNNAGDFVTFGDTAATSTVHLVTAALTPGSVTVNNSLLTYTFTGSGKLSGTTGLTKQGSGTLTIANSSANDFSGGITLSAGKLNFAQPIDATAGNSISGAGGVVKSGPSTLTLNGANSYSGGLTVSNGVLRATTSTAAGNTTVTVYTGGTFVAGATQTNTYTLAGGTFGIVSGAMNTVPGELTAAAGTTSTLYIADPQNLAVTDASEVGFTNTWHGSGNVIVATVTNDTAGADSGNGFRLRGTAVSDYSGTLTLSNNVKGELQTSVAGPFSPAGTGKVVLMCGTYNGTNSLGAPTIGGYSELNLRNNGTGDTVLGNSIELAGSGLALLNPLGTAPLGAKVTMGNLRLGGGQELGLYLSANPSHNIVFPTVTLTGGTIRFSPKTPDFGALASVGSDLTLGDLSQTAASSIIMNGMRTLFITGTSTHSGSTTISNGTLHLSGALNGGGALTVAGGTLMGNGSTAGGVTVHPAGTIAPGASVGQLTAAGAVVLQGTNVMEIDRDAATNDVLQGSSITFGGTLVISSLTSALQAGDFFKLYTGPRSGSFSAIIPNEPGSGLQWDTSSLVSDGILKVASAGASQPYITSIVLSGTTLTISGTNSTASGDFYVLSSTDVTLPIATWPSIATNSFSGGNFSVPLTVNPNEPQRYYLLQVP